ncbi:MAG: hypothetical protein OES18_02945 [Deltaproteobacteria bacterium]|nr:hypothetical protein [Deltaproteobacteria bacterium]
MVCNRNFFKEENVMKKIMIAALALLTVLAFSIPATAADLNNASGTVAFGGASYDMSNAVYVDYSNDVPTNAQYYGISTVHSGGNRMFATTSETSVIWWRTVVKGCADPDNIDETWTSGQFSTPWFSL